jgi:DNA primase
MAEIPEYIKQIIRERKITDFLNDRNINLVKETGGKQFYCCPLHEGDNDPSFVVYVDTEYQNYYCYGCHSGGNIVNLLKDFDGIDIGYAIRKLAKGLQIDEISDLDSEIKTIVNSSVMVQNEDAEELFLKINRTYYSYLEEVNFDEQEILFFEQFFAKLDEVARYKDKSKKLKQLKRIYDYLVDKGIPIRRNKYEERKEQKIIKSLDKKEIDF